MTESFEKQTNEAESQTAVALEEESAENAGPTVLVDESLESVAESGGEESMPQAENIEELSVESGEAVSTEALEGETLSEQAERGLLSKEKKELLKAGGITALKVAGSITGLKSLYDVPAYVYQRYQVRGMFGRGEGLTGTTENVLEATVQNVEEQESREAAGETSRRELFSQLAELEANGQEGGEEHQALSEQLDETEPTRVREALSELNRKLALTKEGDTRGSEARNLMAKVLRENRRIEKAEREDFEGDMSNVIDNYLETKVTGMEAAKSSVNTALVASGAYGLKGFSAGIFDASERFKHFRKEAARTGESFDTKEFVVGGVRDTWNQLWMEDESGEKSKFQRGMDAIQAAGTFGRYVGLGLTAEFRGDAIKEQMDGALDTLSGKTSFGEMGQNFKGNIDRLVERAKGVGQYVKETFTGSTVEASEVALSTGTPEAQSQSAAERISELSRQAVERESRGEDASALYRQIGALQRIEQMDTASAANSNASVSETAHATEITPENPEAERGSSAQEVRIEDVRPIFNEQVETPHENLESRTEFTAGKFEQVDSEYKETAAKYEEVRQRAEMFRSRGNLDVAEQFDQQARVLDKRLGELSNTRAELRADSHMLSNEKAAQEDLKRSYEELGIKPPATAEEPPIENTTGKSVTEKAETNAHVNGLRDALRALDATDPIGGRLSGIDSMDEETLKTHVRNEFFEERDKQGEALEEIEKTRAKLKVFMEQARQGNEVMQNNLPHLQEQARELSQEAEKLQKQVRSTQELAESVDPTGETRLYRPPMGLERMVEEVQSLVGVESEASAAITESVSESKDAPLEQQQSTSQESVTTAQENTVLETEPTPDENYKASQELIERFKEKKTLGTLTEQEAGFLQRSYEYAEAHEKQEVSALRRAYHDAPPEEKSEVLQKLYDAEKQLAETEYNARDGALRYELNSEGGQSARDMRSEAQYLDGIYKGASTDEKLAIGSKTLAMYEAVYRNMDAALEGETNTTRIQALTARMNSLSERIGDMKAELADLEKAESEVPAPPGVEIETPQQERPFDANVATEALKAVGVEVREGEDPLEVKAKVLEVFGRKDETAVNFTDRILEAQRKINRATEILEQGSSTEQARARIDLRYAERDKSIHLSALEKTLREINTLEEKMKPYFKNDKNLFYADNADSAVKELLEKVPGAKKILQLGDTK